MRNVKLGIPGVQDVRPGTHLCALYSGPHERDRLLLPFLREGMRDGDKCLYLVDDVTPTVVRDQVEDAGATSRPHRADQLNIDLASSVYLQAGYFSVERMISFLATSLSEASEDFPFLRAAGEMSWVLPTSVGADDFFAYESGVNDVVEDAPAVFMCLYDLQRFSAQMLVDVMYTHPQVLLDDRVIDNPHYLTPTEYRATRARHDRTLAAPLTYPLAHVPRPSARPATGDRWSSLTESETRVAQLVATGMTNRSIAEKLTLSPHTVDAHLKHVYTKLDIHSRVELTVLAMEHLQP
ncbi:MAG: MEDS domain-containing protein [Propionibacteriaceae bacterium]